MLAEVWYVLLAGMLAVYVILDGFDLGAGMLHLFVAKTNAERNVVLRSIGPVWDGNEVWLLAAGGTMILAFPMLYARAFSGFYLPLMIVLWFLVFRALGIELRHHVDHPLWRQFWDVAFSLSSLLLTIFFGAALGNVVRGVAMNDAGVFFAPLWTNFRVDPEPGILDWYTLIVALNATIAVAMHGAAWIGWRATGDVQRRCGALLWPLWTATLALTAVTTVATYFVQPSCGGGSNGPARFRSTGTAQSRLCFFLCFPRRNARKRGRCDLSVRPSGTGRNTRSHHRASRHRALRASGGLVLVGARCFARDRLLHVQLSKPSEALVSHRFRTALKAVQPRLAARERTAHVVSGNASRIFESTRSRISLR
jgi:hypothetical protein